MAYGSRFCDLFGGVELLPRHAATQKLKLAVQASASTTLALIFVPQLKAARASTKHTSFSQTCREQNPSARRGGFRW